MKICRSESMASVIFPNQNNHHIRSICVAAHVGIFPGSRYPNSDPCKSERKTIIILHGDAWHHVFRGLPISRPSWRSRRRQRKCAWRVPDRVAPSRLAPRPRRPSNTCPRSRFSKCPPSAPAPKDRQRSYGSRVGSGEINTFEKRVDT